MKTQFITEEALKGEVAHCQIQKHIQQVAFSTYHHALTQVCFTCKKVRTSINKEDLE